MAGRATEHANALHQGRDLDASRDLFEEAETLQGESKTRYPLLNSLGYPAHSRPLVRQ